MQLISIADKLELLVPVEDRQWRMRSYEKCFIAEDAVEMMMEQKFAVDVADAISIGQQLQSANVR